MNLIEHYNKPSKEFKKEHFFSKLTGKTPSDKKIARTNENIKELNHKTGKDLTMVYCKGGTILLANTLSKSRKDFFQTHGLDPFFSVFLPGYFQECNFYESKQYLDYSRDKKL